MNKTWKIITALTLLVALYGAQNPKAIENIEREIARYDSLHKYDYAHESTKEEIEAMEADRIFEGIVKKKKGGKSNGN